ncbi:MAG: nitroreductase family protein [Actinomycetota bacterium]
MQPPGLTPDAPHEPATDAYQRTVDHALMTTRGVRARLDFDRPVDDQTILDCIDVAEQAPTGGNNGSRRWLVIRDQATKDAMAELYLSAGVSWVIETADRIAGTGHPNERLMAGAKHLGENLARIPALVIPTIIGVHDGSGRPGLFDSVIQSAWSFMVALRARGLGTVWTTMYLNERDAVAELLGLPDDVTQICLFPVAHTIGTDFSATSRRYPARDITYFDRYGRTLDHEASSPRSLADGPGVVAEADIKAKPEAVWALVADGRRPESSQVEESDPPRLLTWAEPDPGGAAERWRVTIEKVPGGSRIRVHCLLGAGPSRLADAIAATPDREPEILARRQDQRRAEAQQMVAEIKTTAEAGRGEGAPSGFPGLGDRS